MADPFSTTNGLVQNYRKFLESSGRVDRRSDLELTVELGGLLKQQGTFDTQAEVHPDFREQYLAATQATDRSYAGEVTAAVRRSGRGLGATAIGATALGADIVGADEASRSLAAKAKNLESSHPEDAPTVERMADIRSVDGAIRYGLGKVGEALPSLAEALITATIGAAAGSGSAPGPGTAAGAVAGLVGKRAVKQMISRGIAKRILGEEVAEEALEAALKAGANKALQSAFVSESRTIAARMGGAAASALNSLALNSGGIYNETGDAALSLTAGAIAAAPDTILPSYLVGRFFRGAASQADVAKAGGFIRRLATEAVKITPIEASTEAFQELVGIAAEKFHKGEPASLDAKDIERLKEAAVGGAAGGLVAAPIAAAPSPSAAPAPTTNPALEARRRAASGLPAAQPTTPAAAPSRGERLRQAMTLSPELQDARIAALTQLSGRTAAEEQEIEVLRALQSQRPSNVARTPTPAAEAAPATEAPAAPVVAPPPPTGAAPLVSAPTPAPVTPPSPTATPATPLQLSGRIRAAGAKLGVLVTRAPSLDTSTVRAQLDAIGKAGSSAADVDALEASIAMLEGQAVMEAAKAATAGSVKKQELAASRAAETAARLEQKASAAAERARKAAEKAAKKLAPTPASTPPSADTLAQDLGAAFPPLASLPDGAIDIAATPAVEQADLPARFEAGPIAQDGVISFQQLAEGLAAREVGAMTDESKAKLRSFNFNRWLEGVIAEKTKSGKPGLFFDASGNRSRTRMAVAFLMPDGRVIQAGVLPGKNVQSLGEGGAKLRGNAVQRMGTESRRYEKKNGVRSAAIYTKTLEPGGNKPVLFDDLVKAGAIPFDAVLFEREPGEIYQEFKTREAYEAALAGTEKKLKSVAVTEGGAVTEDGNADAAELAEARAAILANQTAEPGVPAQQRIAELFAENPNYLAALTKKMQQMGGDPDAAFAKLPAEGRKQISAALAEVSATQEEMAAYLRENVGTTVDAPPALPAAQVEAAQSTPAPANAGGHALPNIERVVPKFLERLHPLIAKTGSLDIAKFSPQNSEAVLKLLEQTRLGSWDEFKAKIDGAFAATKTPAEFAAILKGARRIEDAANPAADYAQAERFRALAGRLRSAGFDLEVIEKDLSSGVGGWYRDGKLVVALEDLANANLAGVRRLIHEAGHALVDGIAPEKRGALARAANRAISGVADGRQLKAAKNASENWEEKLVDATAIKLAEEGFGAESPSLASALWRAIKDIYQRAGMAMLRALGIDPSDTMVLAWWDNNMRRLLGGDYDYRFIDLFRPFIEKPAERVGRYTVIDGQTIPELVDPLTKQLHRAEVLPDSVDAAKWNLTRFMLTRDEGFYKGKKFSEVLAAVRPEAPPAPINPNLSVDTAVRFLFEMMQRKGKVMAADGRTIDLQTGDSETARLLFGNNASAITSDQRLRARAVHLVTSGEERTRGRPEKLAGVGLILSTLEKADLVLETPSQDARTPDQKNIVYVKLYKTAERPAPTWHFVRTDQAGRLISQHTTGPHGGRFTPPIESGRVTAATGERGGGSSERAPRHQTGSRVAAPSPSEGSSAGLSQVSELASLIGIVNPTGWSKEKLSATVLKGVTDGLITEVEAGPLLGWIAGATPEQRQEAWKAGGAKLMEEAIGASAELGMDYTEAMARVQAAAWGELMPAISRMKTELGADLTEAQYWAKFGRGALPSEIVNSLETRVPGSANAAIGGARMTEPMNQRARYQAFRLANTLATLNRRRAASDEERLARHTEAIAERAKVLNKIDREYRDAQAMNAHFSDELRSLIKELAADLDRGPDTAFAAGKLAGAIREVERLTPEEAIPAGYQQVLKQLLDADGTSVFDQLSAIARLNLPLGRMTISEVVAAIRENAAADSRLNSLAQQRPLMVTLATLARNSTRQMDLLQLRTLKDSTLFLAIKADLDEIRTASETRLGEMAKAIAESQESKSLRDRLRGEYIKARRNFTSAQRAIQQAQEAKLQRSRFADALAEKAVDLSREVGAFSFWEATDGAAYHAMQRADDGAWTSVKRTLRMVGDEVAEQHERVAHDLAMNRLWLQAHRDQAGSRLYEEVRRQTDELSKLDFAKNYEATHRFLLDKYLQPLGQKFASTGKIAGVKIRQMLNAWQSVMFVHSDSVETAARRWNKALQEAAAAAGYSNPKRFFDEVMNDVIYHIESEPGRDENGAMRAARKAARRRIPEGFAVADSFDDKLARLLTTHREASELLLKIAEDHNVFVSDPRIRDPLTEKGNLLRHAIKYGWLTSTRRFNHDIVRTLVNDMQAAGWSDELFANITAEAAPELIARYFTPTVIDKFVVPFVEKPGKEVFFGANDADGRPTPISQVDAQLAWQSAGGDLLKFIEAMFDRTNQANDREGLPAYQAAILKRLGELYTMESKLVAAAGQAKDAHDPFGNKRHRAMDGRVNDLIPPQHFSYDLFTPIDARRALTEVAYHAAFGRDGNALDKAMTDLQADLATDARHYREIPAGSRKEKAAYAAAQGWDFKKIERAASDERDIRAWKQKLTSHFGGKEAVVGDAHALLELAQLNVSLVLNQPKSGLANLVSLMEYPLVYRGLGKAAVRASASAAKIFARDVGASFLQSVGINFQRTADYAKEIADVVERRQSERLPFGTLLSDIGPDGRFASGGVGNRVTQVSRGIQTAMRKGVGAGGFNALWAPFNFISTKADTAMATANVQTLEMIVKRAIDYFEANPAAFDNPAFRLTAEQLGMTGGGWFSDEGAFAYFRERAVDYGLGSLEQIARDAMARRNRNEPLLSRDQALGAAMMALNEVSLQSSVNSRPIELMDNPWLRAGGLMLGWPLAKMHMIHDAMKTPDGRISMASAGRALGVLAAWTLPVGLAYSLLMDEYDEKILSKKSNIRDIDPVAIIPLAGPVIAAASDHRNLLGMLERLARAGTYGLGGDFINSMANWVDPSTGQRDFDLNSRVFIFSQLANFRDALKNLIHQDFEVTYQSVTRPLFTLMGGGGVLQATQIINNALDLTNAEAAVTNRINVNNWLRAAGREAGLELRMGAGRSSPTPLSVWLQQMQTAALSNDRLGFAEAYREAVDVARRQGEADPESTVLSGFKSRHPLSSVFRTKPTETQYASLMTALDDDGRRVVRDALSLFDSYVEMIEPHPLLQRMRQQVRSQQSGAGAMTIEQLRRRAAQGSLGY